MTTTSRWLLWIPRLLGILAGLVLGLFALDAFSEGKPLAQALPDFIIHLLPGAVLFAVVALSWRWPWVGAAVRILREYERARIRGPRPRVRRVQHEPARLDPDHLRAAGDRRRAVLLELASPRAASPPEVAPHLRGRRNIPTMVSNIPRDG